MTNDDTKQFDSFAAVQDFYLAAGFDPSRELAHSLIREEAQEVFEAAKALIKELADLEYVVIGAVIGGHHVDMPQDLNDAINRVAHLFNLIPGPIHQEAFRRVHLSNMSKLVEGRLERDPETGKVLKGPNYQPPDLSDLI